MVAGMITVWNIIACCFFVYFFESMFPLMFLTQFLHFSLDVTVNLFGCKQFIRQSHPHLKKLLWERRVTYFSNLDVIIVEMAFFNG